MNRIDVVIPVFNQLLPLKLTLEGFIRQTFPMDQVTILIVDDGSTEPIKELVDQFCTKLPIRYIRLNRSGRAAARNAGVRQSNGQLLVFCDADRIPRSDFLYTHDQTAQQHRATIVVGQVREMYITNLKWNEQRAREQVIAETHDRIPAYCKLIYQLYEQSGRTVSPIAWITTLTGNLSLPRSLFELVGGFDEGFREWGFEHFEFGFRASLQSIPFHYSSKAINFHLAHSRDNNAYMDHIRSSHAFFLDKHKHPAVEKLLDFMLGYVSLQQFEAYASGLTNGEYVNRDHDSSQYVHIHNF